MADIFLTNGDIDCTMYGDIAVVYSYDDITQSAVNNILTIYGENEYHPNIGNKIHSKRLKIALSSVDIIKNDCKDAIMADDRISDVLSIDVTDPGDGNVNISFTIKATDGTIMSSDVLITI